MHGFAAVWFHGEQLIPIILGIAAVIVAVLSGLAYVTVRLFRKRFGRKAVLSAPLPFILFAIIIWAWSWTEKPNSGPPRVVQGNDILKKIASLPSNAQFSYTGAAYFNNRLYLGSNIGLFEISNGVVSSLYQVQRKYSVTSGPWVDRADGLLWIEDEQTQELLSFDGSSWQRTAVPKPRKGYGSFAAEGIKPVSNEHGFWIMSGGMAWRWDKPTHQWVEEPAPQFTNFSGGVLGMLPLEGGIAYLVRHELLPFLKSTEFKPDTIVITTDQGWREIPRAEGADFLADLWDVADGSGYVCDKEGSLFVVTQKSVSPVKAPGPCEALSTDESGHLVASFRGAGAFRLRDGVWQLISSAPVESGEGEYWTYIATSGGEVAYVMDAKPVIDKEKSAGFEMKWKQNAATAAWVSRGTQLTEIRFR